MENLMDKIDQELKDIEASCMGLRQLLFEYEEATNSQIADLEKIISGRVFRESKDGQTD